MFTGRVVFVVRDCVSLSVFGILVVSGEVVSRGFGFIFCGLVFVLFFGFRFGNVVFFGGFFVALSSVFYRLIYYRFELLYFGFFYVIFLERFRGFYLKRF